MNKKKTIYRKNIDPWVQGEPGPGGGPPVPPHPQLQTLRQVPQQQQLGRRAQEETNVNTTTACDLSELQYFHTCWIPILIHICLETFYVLHYKIYLHFYLHQYFTLL